jgi:hypothetical protein
MACRDHVLLDRQPRAALGAGGGQRRGPRRGRTVAQAPELPCGNRRRGGHRVACARGMRHGPGSVGRGCGGAHAGRGAAGDRVARVLDDDALRGARDRGVPARAPRGRRLVAGLRAGLRAGDVVAPGDDLRAGVPWAVVRGSRGACGRPRRSPPRAGGRGRSVPRRPAVCGVPGAGDSRDRRASGRLPRPRRQRTIAPRARRRGNAVVDRRHMVGVAVGGGDAAGGGGAAPRTAGPCVPAGARPLARRGTRGARVPAPPRQLALRALPRLHGAGDRTPARRGERRRSPHGTARPRPRRASGPSPHGWRAWRRLARGSSCARRPTSSRPR